MSETAETERLTLVDLSPAVLEALIGRDVARAETIGGMLIPAGWPDEHDRRWLELRLRRMREDPATEGWFTRAMVLRDDPRRPMIGHIGFHGPPREHGEVEMGYTVFPEYRRQGFAIEAARGLMDWVRREHGIRSFVVSISPDNEPSLKMADRLGFRRAGEQWDEEDGLEWVFQLDVD